MLYRRVIARDRSRATSPAAEAHEFPLLSKLTGPCPHAMSIPGHDSAYSDESQDNAGSQIQPDCFVYKYETVMFLLPLARDLNDVR